MIGLTHPQEKVADTAASKLFFAGIYPDFTPNWYREVRQDTSGGAGCDLKGLAERTTAVQHNSMMQWQHL